MAHGFWSGKDSKAVLQRAVAWVLVSVISIGLRYDALRRVHAHGSPASAFEIFTMAFWVAVLLFWVVIAGRSWVLLRCGARLPEETA